MGKVNKYLKGKICRTLLIGDEVTPKEGRVGLQLQRHKRNQLKILSKANEKNNIICVDRWVSLKKLTALLQPKDTINMIAMTSLRTHFLLTFSNLS